MTRVDPKSAGSRWSSEMQDKELPPHIKREVAEEEAAQQRRWSDAVKNPAAYGFHSVPEAECAAKTDRAPQTEAEVHEYAKAWDLLDELDEVQGELDRYASLQPATITEADAKAAGVANRKKHLADIEARLQALNPLPLRPSQQAQAKRTRRAGADHADSTNWKVVAQQLARELIAERGRMDLYPSQQDVSDYVAKRMRENGDVGPMGKPLTAAYIKRHALAGIFSNGSKRQLQKARQGK